MSRDVDEGAGFSLSRRGDSVPPPATDSQTSSESLYAACMQQQEEAAGEAALERAKAAFDMVNLSKTTFFSKF